MISEQKAGSDLELYVKYAPLGALKPPAPTKKHLFAPT